VNAGALPFIANPIGLTLGAEPGTRNSEAVKLGYVVIWRELLQRPGNQRDELRARFVPVV
jgi:hypothetical protein